MICEQHVDTASKREGLPALADLIPKGELNNQQEVQKQDQGAQRPAIICTEKARGPETNGAEGAQSPEINNAESRPMSKLFC